MPASPNYNDFDSLLAILHGAQYAAGLGVDGAPVVVVSSSYGYEEEAVEADVTSLDATYLATGASTGVAMTFEAGVGRLPDYPATSPNAIAVGGTALYFISARGRYGAEIAWGGGFTDGAGGGGLSSAFGAPAFQGANGVSFPNRALPDVSMNADGITAVSVYDSLDGDSFEGGEPWFSSSGPGEATSLFAGVLALAQQDRLAVSEPILNSVEVNTAMYEAYNSPSYLTYFHDITVGNTNVVNFKGQVSPGYPAAPGYDLATGIGSPIVNTLVPYLANYVIGT